MASACSASSRNGQIDCRTVDFCKSLSGINAVLKFLD